MISYTAVLCKLCGEVCQDRNLCSCKNVGVITDADEHINLYVDDITTTQRVRAYSADDKLVTYELLKPFDEAVHVEYEFYNIPFTVKNIIPVAEVLYDSKLVKLLKKEKPMNNKPKVKVERLEIRLAPNQKEALVKMAKEAQLSMSNYIIDALKLPEAIEPND